MAKNRVYERGQYLSLVCSSPTTPASGDPVLIGQLPGVAQANEEADGLTSVDLGPAVYSLPVSASGGAVTVGARIYAAAGSPVILSITNTGVPFGFALGAVPSGTAVINVKIQGF